MNVPHEKICIECGSYMVWCKNHYECPVCGYVGKMLWQHLKVGAIVLGIIGIVFFFGNFLIS